MRTPARAGRQASTAPDRAPRRTELARAHTVLAPKACSSEDQGMLVRGPRHARPTRRAARRLPRNPDTGGRTMPRSNDGPDGGRRDARRVLLRAAGAAALLVLAAPAAEARIKRIEVDQRVPAYEGAAVGEVGPYEW